jgi:hypothetical protein
MLAPQVFAQAPAPKVTITGTFDQITATGKNWYDGNFARNGDREWYARTRFRPDFVFEVGRTKAVLGLEIDLTYGQTGPQNSYGAGKAMTVPGATGTSGSDYVGARPGTTADMGLNNDVTGVIEIKWIYTEFDLTGKDSLMPFIPVQTVARAGGQPFATLSNWKTAAYTSGDFAGVSAITTWAPNLKTNFAYVMIEEELATLNRSGSIAVMGTGIKPTRGEDFALIVSSDYTPMKGLDLKPMYSYVFAQGLTSSQTRRNVVNRMSAGGTIAGAAAYASGTAPSVLGAAGNGYSAGDPTLHENRHTFGLDAVWNWGPFGLQPTIYYQVGSRDTQCLCPDTATGGAFITQRSTAAASAWLVDIIASYQTGPFLLEVRPIYSTGNSARDNLAKRVRYFEVLDADTSYYYDWAQIWALGIDYFSGLGGVNNGMSTNVGYDRYGRAQLGVRATYNVTPALAFRTIVSPTWTAEAVDTKTNSVGGARTIVYDKSFTKGDSNYLGTEWDLGLTWRFAPNTAFDLVGGWLFAGSALDTTELLNGVATKRKAEDAWTVASRVRLSF